MKRFLLRSVVAFYRLFPVSVRKKILDRKRYKKGLIGFALRYCALKSIAEKCGEKISIGEGCFFPHAEKLCIGSNVSINSMCYIDAAGGVEIGDDVSIAHGVTIMSTEHKHSDPSVPVKLQGYTYEKTVVGYGSWIGAKATILSGSVIGEQSVVGAGAVVTKNLPGRGVYVGVPAKLIKTIGNGNAEKDLPETDLQ